MGRILDHLQSAFGDSWNDLSLSEKGKLIQGERYELYQSAAQAQAPSSPTEKLSYVRMYVNPASVKNRLVIIQEYNQATDTPGEKWDAVTGKSLGAELGWNSQFQGSVSASEQLAPPMKQLARELQVGQFLPDGLSFGPTTGGTQSTTGGFLRAEPVDNSFANDIGFGENTAMRPIPGAAPGTWIVATGPRTSGGQGAVVSDAGSNNGADINLKPTTAQAKSNEAAPSQNARTNKTNLKSLMQSKLGQKQYTIRRPMTTLNMQQGFINIKMEL